MAPENTTRPNIVGPVIALPSGDAWRAEVGSIFLPKRKKQVEDVANALERFHSAASTSLKRAEFEHVDGALKILEGSRLVTGKLSTAMERLRVLYMLNEESVREAGPEAPGAGSPHSTFAANPSGPPQASKPSEHTHLSVIPEDGSSIAGASEQKPQQRWDSPRRDEASTSRKPTKEVSRGGPQH
jgi:hypothetical protein